MTENYIEILSAIPLVLVSPMAVAAFWDLWCYITADKHFTQAVARKLANEAAIFGDKEPNGMRHLYLMNLLGARKSTVYDEDEKRIFVAALNELTGRDRRLIKSALKDNTDLGRVRYLDKVFNAALKLSTH